MNSNTEEGYLLERNNSRRIERLESDVNEIRQQIAAMPGRIVTELENLHPRSEKYNALAWAFSVLMTIIGAIAWNFYNSDMRQVDILETIKSELLTHIKDGHPERLDRAIDANTRAIENLQGYLLEQERSNMKNLLEHEKIHAEIGR